MSVDWSSPVQDGFANVRLVGILNVKEGPTHVVVRLDENGFDVSHNMHIVYENGCTNNSGIPSAFDVTNRKVTLIVYAVYDRHGEYLESHENLKDAQDVSSCYSDSTIVEMTGVIERDALVPYKVHIKFYAAVDRDGTVFFWGTHKAHMEDTVSKSVTPLVLVEFDKTIEWPH